MRLYLAALALLLAGPVMAQAIVPDPVFVFLVVRSPRIRPESYGLRVRETREIDSRQRANFPARRGFKASRCRDVSLNPSLTMAPLQCASLRLPRDAAP
jgi:hypothetical protein